jgi:hypothetical protein
MAAYGSTCGFATHSVCESRCGCSVYQRPRNPGNARPAPLRLSPAPRSFKVAVHCVIGLTLPSPPPCIQAMNFFRFVSRIRVTFQPIPNEGGDTEIWSTGRRPVGGLWPVSPEGKRLRCLGAMKIEIVGRVWRTYVFPGTRE